MSEFDLTRIVESLQSTKLKNRNDALNLLSGFSVKKLKLTSHQLASLVSALVKSIEAERDAFSKSNANSAVTRAAIGSGLLRDLVQDSLCKSSSSRDRIRSKTCLTLISSLISLYYVPATQSPFQACSGNFLQILSSLFEAPFVFTRLGTDLWLKCYHFLLQATAYELSLESERGISENLVGSLYSAMFLLLDGDSDWPLSPFVKDSSYFPLLNLLTKTLAQFNKRESSVLVTAFKIINHLLLSLSTEDAQFLHHVIRVGLGCALRFSSTSVANLQEQLLLFFNSDSFHMYLSLRDLPKQVSLQANDTFGDALPNEDLALTVYNLEKLIHSLVNDTSSLSLNLRQEDVGIRECTNTTGGCSLPGIYPLTDNCASWLLASAISKLVATYYNLRRAVSPTDSTDPGISSVALIDRSVSASFYKRQKLQDKHMSLLHADSETQFYGSFLVEESFKLQRRGLQLLAFSFERSVYAQSKGKMSGEEGQESSSSASDTSKMPNTHSENSNDSLSELLECVPNIICLMTDKDNSFWALLAIRSMLITRNNGCCAEQPEWATNLQRILKISLDLVKEKSAGPLACSVFGLIATSQASKDLEILADTTLLNQLDNAVELSDISGPVVLDKHAVSFWMSVSLVYAKYNNRKQLDLPRAIAKWLCDRWRGILQSGSMNCPSEISGSISQIVMWLSGSEVGLNASAVCEECPDSVAQRSKRQELIKFINLKTSQVATGGNPRTEASCLQYSNESMELIKICFNSDSQFRNDENTFDSYAFLLSVYVKMADHTREAVPHISLAFEEKAKVIISILSPAICSKDEALLLINALLRSNPTENILREVAFPFEIIDYHLRFASNNLRRAETSVSELDAEFADKSEPRAKFTSSLLSRDASLDQICYFEFLMRFNKTQPKDCVEYMGQLPSDSMLKCLSKLIESAADIIHYFDTDALSRIVRLIGEKLLTSQDYDRSDSTIRISCSVLDYIARAKEFKLKEELGRDVLDLVTYFYQCLDKDLLISTRAQGSIWTFVLSMSKSLRDTINSERDISDTFLGRLANFTNGMKISVSESLRECLSTWTLEKQSTFFTKIVDSFVSPQSSVESLATFCLFLVRITQERCFDAFIITHLIKFSRFEFAVPYVRAVVTRLASTRNYEDETTFFEQLRLEILKTWWLEGHSFESFPFSIFGYASKIEFFSANLRHVMAMMFSTPSDAKRVSKMQSFTRSLSSMSPQNVEHIMRAGLPLTIALSYTPKGIRSEIFSLLRDVFQTDYKKSLQEMLILTVLQVINTTDVSSEASVAKALRSQCTVDPPYLDDLAGQYTKEVIAPSSSVELIAALIKSFGTSSSNAFWSFPVVYFLTRQIGKEAISRDVQKNIYVLRRVRFLLLLSETRVHDFTLVKLILNISIATLRNGCYNEAASLMALVDFDGFRSLPSEKSLPIILKLLATTVSLGPSQCCIFEGVLRNLKRLDSEASSVFGPATKFVSCAIKSLTGAPFHISMADVESFLNDEKYDDLTAHSAENIFTILSAMSNDINLHSPIVETYKLVAMYFHQRAVKYIDRECGFWFAEYLAQFYLSGRASTDLRGLLSRGEHPKFDKPEFIDMCKSLNFVLSHLLEILEWGDYEKCAIIECAFGALINEFKANRRVLLKFMDCDLYFTDLEKYVLPLGDQYRTLLSVETAHIPVKDVSLKEFVDDFQNVIASHSFEDWTCQLLILLVKETCSTYAFAPILISCVKTLSSFVRQILPSFVCYYVFVSDEMAQSNINSLFCGFWNSPQRSMCEESIEMMNNIGIMLRIGAMHDIDQFKRVYGMINRECLSQIAREAHSPKTALMFFEDWISKSEQGPTLSSSRATIAHLFKSLDDEDLLSGIPGQSTIEESFNLNRAFLSSNEKLKYDSGIFDASLVLGDTLPSKNVIESLMEEGYVGASKMLGDHCEESVNSEWAWKLSHWDAPVNTDETKDGNNVICGYFKRARDDLSSASDTYRASMLRLLSSKPCESDANIASREFILRTEKWLESLAVMKSTHSIIASKPSDIVSEIKGFETQTKWFERVESCRFENILTGRRLAFALRSEFTVEEMGLERASLISCEQGEVNEVVRSIHLARTSNRPQKCISSSILLEKLVKRIPAVHQSDFEDLRRLSLFQTAQTLWAEGKVDGSVTILENLSYDGDITSPLANLNVSQSLMNAQLAVWLAESRSELGPSILNRIVDPISADLDRIGEPQQRYKICHLLASFCESQFRSPNLKEQLLLLETRVNARKDELQEIKAHYSKGEVSSSERNVARAYYDNLKSLFKSESKELLNMLELRTRYAHNSVKFYLKALNTTIASDEHFERFFSLFLELSGDEILQSSIQDELSSLPSHQPLAWCSQILSRVSKEKSNFQKSIQNLVFRICCDHPFHSLYYLTSLLLHESLAKQTNNPAMISRIVATTNIKNRLQAHGASYSTSYLLPVEQLCLESISLAEVKSPRGRNLQLDKLKIGSYWLKELPAIPPPTLEIPVNPHGDYSGVPVMVKMDAKVSIASSGISLPKVATFMLSDGTKHKMLLKHGTDDLRQDAIMEQVFHKVNKIFQEDKETRKRNLRVRTYKAVPLGPKAGVIEFVPDSKALFDVILPYHLARDSMKLDKARELMKNHQTSTMGERLKIYQGIEKKIQPVLRIFFLKSFTTPDAWFASRQIYVRGVATSSIVGHVLGLGDRHCNNILLDEFTGEPIHIDLGVAFDQGKRLKVPETVPFRLTRDVVDGFGFLGTAGPFTKVSEHTFRVLRDSKDHILAILDVLRWDPLYSWSISPIRQKRLQDENAEITNPDAKPDGSAATKAILGVSDKLNAGGLNVEAAVRELIREAVSEQNLATIYCGWCPFY